ncbi:MAG: GerMN domain-containing protein [Clostridia bacterium]|nr:GerMN domain-containing protein [Clostridia bacterium]
MKRSWIKHTALSALLLLSALALAGCAGGIEERPMADLSQSDIEPGMPAPTKDAADARTFTATLYFLEGESGMLRPVHRRITAPGEESLPDAALSALLGGPSGDEAGVTWPDLGAGTGERMLEVSSGVATVDLPARARLLPQETLFALRQAIANTLTEFSQITYVNVLIGGREEGLDLGATMPVGALTRQNELDMRAMYARLDEQRAGGGPITRLTTFYVPSADGSKLLPQVRSVEYSQVSPIEYLYTLLDELGKGSDHSLAMKAVPAPMDHITEMPEIVRTEDGYLAIELCLSGTLDEALLEAGLTRGVYLAMLTDTLMGFVPGVEGLLVRIGDEQIVSLDARETPDGQAVRFDKKLAARSDFAGYIGAPVTLYAMDEESGMLSRRYSIVGEEEADDPHARLGALIRLKEEGVFSLPEEAEPEDVLAVHTGEDAIAVNLSARFADALSDLPRTHERIAVYAMVNTLTEGTDISKVYFFFDGEQVKRLAGELDMRGAFVRNPGMVVK